MLIKEYLADLIYPRKIKCALCENEVENRHFCKTCEGSIQFNVGKTCNACGRMIYGEGNVCNHCKSFDRFYDRGISVATYDAYIKNMIYKFKYNNKTHIGYTIAYYLLDKIAKLDTEIEFDFITFVPLHKKRLNKRGYNQAEIIAKFMSEKSGIPIIDALRRKKKTKPLYQLDPEERNDALLDAFELNQHVIGNCILVDDIFTTGSTVNNCSKVLKREGVDYILIAVFTAGE